MLEELLIHDLVSLRGAEAIAHDGRFEIADVEFDEQTSFFRLVFHRPEFERASYQRLFWPLSRRSVPFAKWQLTFKSVSAFRVIEQDGCAESISSEIASLKFDAENGMLTIGTHYAITIQLSVAELNGALRPLPEPSFATPLTGFCLFR